jgi:hypothetical protein
LVWDAAISGLNRSTANPEILRDFGHAVKTAESKETGAKETRNGSAQFSFCLIADLLEKKPDG